MIYLIAGPSHTGKTLLAQQLLERYHIPYLSLDHLKMGLIRSGTIGLSPTQDEALAAVLWPIAREMIRTAMENRQSLIVEGCYIPYTWQQDFSPTERTAIRYLCLVMSRDYLLGHFAQVQQYANVVEHRLDDSDFTLDTALADNAEALRQCRLHGLPYRLIDGEYPREIDL